MMLRVCLTLLALYMACHALTVSAANTLTTTPGVVLDAPRTETPASLGNPVFRFALVSPAALPDLFVMDSPEWVKWNTTMHAALAHTASSQCPGDASTPNSRAWYWSFCGPNARHRSYTDQCNRLFEVVRDAMTACTVFHREHVYAHTNRHPKEFGGFWSSSCRCVYVAAFLERMFASEHSGIAGVCGVPVDGTSNVVQGFKLQSYRIPTITYDELNLFGAVREQIASAAQIRANGGDDVSIAKNPPTEGRWITESYNCTRGAMSEDDAFSSMGGLLEYTRDALWAIPPISELGPIVAAPSNGGSSGGGGAPSTTAGHTPTNPTDSSNNAIPYSRANNLGAPVLVSLLGVLLAVFSTLSVGH